MQNAVASGASIINLGTFNEWAAQNLGTPSRPLYTDIYGEEYSADLEPVQVRRLGGISFPSPAPPCAVLVAHAQRKECSHGPGAGAGERQGSSSVGQPGLPANSPCPAIAGKAAFAEACLILL